MRSPVTGIVALLVLLLVLIVAYSSVFTVQQTEQALVVRLGEPVKVVTAPGLNFKAPFIDSVISIDNRILDLENPSQEVIAEAKGQSARFLKVYEEYKKAPDVTRERIYLETMERVLGGSEKLIYDGAASGQGVVPYLPLNELSTKRPTTTGQQSSGGTR